MNSYKEKQQARKERYEELAEKNRQESTRRYQSHRDIVDHIPMGQPILVGHHSEGRHRRDLARSDNHMRKSIEHDKTAEYYDNKAAGVGKGGISSDDPEALQKLRYKLERLQANQEYMKRINKIHRAYLKDPASIDKHDLTDQERKTITTYEPRYSWEKNPFPPYSLQNNNGNMGNVRKRIKQLENAPTETKETNYGEIKVIENVEINRIQIIFPGKPSKEVRTALKSHGFRWSPRNTAWQRHLNNSGRYQAENVIKRIATLNAFIAGINN